jgi:predicted transcriptional regulator
MEKSKTSKTKEIELTIKKGSFFSRLISKQDKDFNLNELNNLRQLLSNKRAKLLYTIKNDNPESIYALAKLLKRDLKAVRVDLALLEKFGFIKYEKLKKGKRVSSKPLLCIEELILSFKI